MNTSDETNSAVEPEEERFVQRALAQVERAERFHRIKQIVVTVIVFPGVYYLMESPREHPTFTVVGVVGLMLAACTVKIVWLIHKNTTAILRAIADINRK